MGFYAKDEPAHPTPERAVSRALSRARKPRSPNAIPPMLTVGIGHRFYRPELGRWLSRDPLGERAGPNVFAAAGNQLLSRIDLLGVAATATPPGWEDFDCCELKKWIDKFAKELLKRHGDLLLDVHALYGNPSAVSRKKGGLGTWDGHVQKYNEEQGRLREFVQKYRDNNCEDPLGDSEKWAFTPAPERPVWANEPMPRLSGGERAGLIIGGLLLGIGTLIEDVVTGGGGIVDDGVTLVPAGSMIGRGLGWFGAM